MSELLVGPSHFSILHSDFRRRSSRPKNAPSHAAVSSSFQILTSPSARVREWSGWQMSSFQFHASRFKAPPGNVLRNHQGDFLIQRIRLQQEVRIDHYSHFCINFFLSFCFPELHASHVTLSTTRPGPARGLQRGVAAEPLLRILPPLDSSDRYGVTRRDAAPAAPAAPRLSAKHIEPVVRAWPRPATCAAPGARRGRP